MLSHVADSFWYWDVGAFVFAGDKTTVSVSGREYKTDDHIIESNDILTIDFSPQSNCIWGDYARTLIVENGRIVKDIDQIQHPDFFGQGIPTKEKRKKRSSYSSLHLWKNLPNYKEACHNPSCRQAPTH